MFPIKMENSNDEKKLTSPNEDETSSTRNFRSRLANIPKDHLEDENGKTDARVWDREDRYWTNSNGDRILLQ